MNPLIAHFQTYVPTVFENYTACLDLEDQRAELSLWDTSGKDNIKNTSCIKMFVISHIFCLWVSQFEITPRLSWSMSLVKQFQQCIHRLLWNLLTLPTTQPAWSRVTNVNEVLSHSLFSNAVYPDDTVCLPCLMQLSSISVVWNLWGQLNKLTAFL